MKQKKQSSFKPRLTRIPAFRRTVIVLCSSLLAVVFAFAQDGAFDWSGSGVVRLAAGIDHAHLQAELPRTLKINCIRVDTKQKSISFYTTPRMHHWVSNKNETVRQTTRDFVSKAHKVRMNMVVAINADAFSPWPAPWNMALPTDLHGLAISDGQLVSPPSGTPSLLVHRDGSLSMKITDAATDLHDVKLAVSGFGYCLESGVPSGSNDVNHPRTGFGLSADRRYLFLMTVDGRRHASLGCTVQEVGEWLKYFGAHTGINMDGGGSTTLVRWDAKSKRPELLNEPVGNGQTWHDKDPKLEQQNYRPTERANGNNFGVIATSP